MIYKNKVNLSIAIISLLKNRINKITISAMSIKLNISISYVEQVIKVLREMGIVNASRGVGGGYLLTYTDKFNTKYFYWDINLAELHYNLYPDLDHKFKETVRSEILLVELSKIIN